MMQSNEVNLLDIEYRHSTHKTNKENNNNLNQFYKLINSCNMYYKNTTVYQKCLLWMGLSSYYYDGLQPKSARE